MSGTRNGLMALSLYFLVAVGLMAFMAGPAQAAWLITPSGTELIKVSMHQEGNLLLSSGVEVKCATIASEDLLLELDSPTETSAKGGVAFNKCHTFKKGIAAPTCDPVNQPIKASLSAHVVLHEGKNYVLFEPNVGERFTEIEFDEELCALVEISEIRGSLVAECGQLTGEGKFSGEDCKNQAISHLLQPATQALSPKDNLKFGELGASVDGIVKAELGGGNTGDSWSGEV